MAGKWVLLGTASAVLWGCATWEPIRNLASAPPGDLGRVRLVTADSMRITLGDAFLIDAGVVGTSWKGQTVRIPVNNISSIERRETDGVAIFVVANVVSFGLLNVLKLFPSSPPPPPVVR